jgi:hypothetical protein
MYTGISRGDAERYIWAFVFKSVIYVISFAFICNLYYM